MGLFDKLFGKSGPSALLQEQFEGLEPVESERSQEICDKFITKGIIAYKKGSFDETALSELTFDELCLVYNKLAKKTAPFFRESAVSYKSFLRKQLLAKLSTFPIYTINAKVTNTPYAFHPSQDPFLLPGEKLDLSLLLYTSKKAAELEFSAIHKVHDWVEIFEITPENFDDVFGEYFCTGYNTVYINGKPQSV